MRNLRFLNISGLVLLCGLSVALFCVIRSPSVGAQNNDQCFSICDYKDSTGTKYVGISGGDCDSACADAKKKCAKAGNGGCYQSKDCTSTNCG